MATLTAETVDVEKAIKLEEEQAPGLIEVRFYTSTPLTVEDAQSIFDHLAAQSVDVRKVYIHDDTGLPYLGVVYYKQPPVSGIGFLPLAVIPLIAFGLVAVLVGIGIFRLGDIVNNLGKLLLIVGGFTVVGIYLWKRPEYARSK